MVEKALLNTPILGLTEEELAAMTGLKAKHVDQALASLVQQRLAYLVNGKWLHTK